MALFASDKTSDGVATIKGLPAPTASGDAANKAYVDSLVEGINWKAAVRARSTGNVTISNPGTDTFDTIVLVSGDRLLVPSDSQTAEEESGIYVFNGSSSALTRAADASTADELEQATVTVQEGAVHAGTTWRQSVVNFTLGTTPQVWDAFGGSVPDATTTTKGKVELATDAETNTGTDTTRAITPSNLAQYTGFAKSVAADFGDGSSTQYDIVHNIGTKDVSCTVRINSTDEVIDVDWIPLNTTTVRILDLTTAPATNAWRAVIQG